MFSCQDIREGQYQKTVAYAQALQYWAEKSNPPHARPMMPFGKVCDGVEKGDEAICDLL